jgi:hypothetical protein
LQLASVASHARSSPIVVTLMMEAQPSSGTSVLASDTAFISEDGIPEGRCMTHFLFSLQNKHTEPLSLDLGGETL